MKKRMAAILFIILSLAIAGCSSNDEAEGEDDKPTLTFGVTPWTSTVPPTKIAEKILEDMGYEVEETEAETGAIYTGMSTGDIDVFMDSWFPNQKQYVEEYEDDIEDVAVSYDDADSGMVVPDYMDDIEDVGDLKGKEDLVDNEIYGIDAGDPAMENMEKVIDAYDLDLELITSSEASMLSAAEDKIENEEPVVFYGWRPHSMFQDFDLHILSNEDAPGDFFSGSSVNVIVPKDLEEEAPEAYEFLSNWSISLDDLEKMIAEIDDGADADDVTDEWIDDHQDEIDEMMP